MKCLCGDVWPGDDADSECPFYECGYEWCPKCDDHHRPPVCVTVIPAEEPSCLPGCNPAR